MTDSSLKLWAHLVSVHAAGVSLDQSFTQLVELHNHEHNMRQTMQAHSREERSYDATKLVMPLAEMHISNMDDRQVGMLYKLFQYEWERRERAMDAVGLTDEERAILHHPGAHNGKLDCIKAVRDRRGLNLVLAKEFVERAIARGEGNK